MTYESINNANDAIDEMNGKSFKGTVLKVSLSRRQPVVKFEKKPVTELAETLSTSEAWSAIASSSVDNTDSSKKRSMVSYDDDYEIEDI